MRAMFVAVLVAGVGLAGFAVHMAQSYIGRTQDQLAKEQELRRKIGPMVEVFVVNKPLNYGDPLTRDDVQKMYWPQNTLPEGVFKSGKELFPEGEKGQRFVLRQMETFEPVLAVKVTEPGEAAGLTGMLTAGQRAFTIQFSDAAGASRFLQPGNRVDIYWTGVTPAGTNETRLIESALAIIAVDRPDIRTNAKAKTETTAPNYAAPKAMTVAATPEQVGRLAQAQASGQLSVALVAHDDPGGAAPSNLVVTGSDIYGDIAAAPVEAAAPPEQCYITTRRGAEVIETPIPCTN